MSSYLPAIFSFLVAAAGFFYLMHASRAQYLVGFELESDNRLRIRLRRAGGIGMILLAIAFFVGYVISDRDGNRILVAICLLAVVVLLLVVLFLAWVDVRLTRKMRESIRKQKNK